MKQKLIYAIYTRSAIKDDKAINSQRHQCEEFILQNLSANNGDILSTKYDDNGYSGLTTNRPALNQLKMDAKNKKFTTIVTSYTKFLRAKNVEDYDALINQFKKLGIEIIFTEL